VRYEWDERKREANLRKHGVDFLRAAMVHESATKITFDVTRAEDPEFRLADFAEVDGVVLKFVYTIRAGAVRCISLRPASKAERKVFYEISYHQKD
jgi:uncharacterized DUF497 family protein